jgi:hypothetical protein
MTTISLQPDLLRRFVATPYVFCRTQGVDRFLIESNDLEIALEIRHYCINSYRKNNPSVLNWKIIRDNSTSKGGSKISIVSDGVLRTLFLGMGTILFFDCEKGELLGFISPGVTGKQLITSLIPILLDQQNKV